MKEQASPFDFGQVVSKDNFVNRKAQLERFKQEVSSGIHQILISPRRIGKSSFVKQAMMESLADKSIVYCFLDMFSIRSEQEFFENLSRKVMQATHTKSEEILNSLRQFLSGLKPRLELSPDPLQKYNIGFEWESLAKHADEVLNFPEKLAVQKNIRLVICLDEFQNISEFTESLSFQKLLRSQWQHHKHVTYCLYGSKRSMMSEMFEKQKMPFYRFGTTFYLDKISEKEFEAYIHRRFEFTGKSIEAEVASKIVNTMESHPYYVQQMAHLVWMETHKKATMQEFEKAMEMLFTFNTILYQRIFEDLSIQQINLLRALVMGGTHLKLTSKKVINDYKLGTSATVLRSLEALEKKEVIDRFTSEIIFIDPGFRLWLRDRVFIRN
jgi:AAA+ ATPase superfamily predicted ATPase